MEGFKPGSTLQWRETPYSGCDGLWGTGHAWCWGSRRCPLRSHRASVRGCACAHGGWGMPVKCLDRVPLQQSRHSSLIGGPPPLHTTLTFFLQNLRADRLPVLASSQKPGCGGLWGCVCGGRPVSLATGPTEAGAVWVGGPVCLTQEGRVVCRRRETRVGRRQNRGGWERLLSITLLTEMFMAR